MPRLKVEWTEPFYGVIHIKKRGMYPQYTACDRGSFCEATVITQGFHASHEKLFKGKDRVRKAQAWLAAKYRQYENGRAILSSSAKSCPTCGRLL